ncbi:MAG: threonine/serine dehydratase [Synergistaceae bacterium]|jgi:threonine dehydratase|nr:threonine/serine dehydratase [Synergistaceae bacterium]
MPIISIKDILEAKYRIANVVHHTPLVRSESLSSMAGVELFLKAENFQKTGSFKIRGACNKIFAIPREEGAKGIITASSGNHGQAVAYACRIFGYEATVIMPEGGSPAKAASIEAYGAKLIYCGTTSEERIGLAKKICRERGLTFIPPYDDPFVMAGQGTTGIEIIEDIDEVAAVLVPTGGCGLISGIATAIKEQKTGIAVFGVEPEGSNSTSMSFRAGKRTALDRIETVADGIKTTIPGELTFPLVQRYVDDMFTVTDDDILHAQFLILERCKMLAEPTGAVSVAAVLSGVLPEKFRGKKIVAVVSGGNMAIPQLADYLKKFCQSRH